MRLVIKEFEIIMSSVAAEGLDKTWLGRKITEEDVDKLVKLNKKIGLNIAGEGGEFETLVVEGPCFKKKLIIEKGEVVMESENTGVYKIEKVKLF
jgi:asparagine synthase (glutamine-hydrolysing)